MYVHHSSLDGYDERQIWHDGCPECEYRGKSLPDSLGALDTGNFAKAWRRADDLRHGTAENISNELLEMLRYIQRMMDSSGLPAEGVST